MLELLDARTKHDVAIADGKSSVSGTVYSPTDHLDFLNEVYARFAHTNPLHADVFPSVARMETEVVMMAASLLGGGPKGP